MTRALHELIDTRPERNTDDEARILDELSQQFKETAAQIAQEHAAKPEDVEDLREASRYLTEHLGHVALSEIIAEMDAAVASDNQPLLDDALNDLRKRFPSDVSNPGLARANIRTIMDHEKAIELARQKGTLVSNEMAVAAAMNDNELGANFDDVIAVSNWTVKEQDGKLDEKTQRDLDELRRQEQERLEVLRRREEERLKLEDMGVEDNQAFDDAQKVDMSALLDDDDEDDKLAA